MKPGSCCLPFFGVDPKVLDAQSGVEVPWQPGSRADGVLAITNPWPGACRTVWGDHERYMAT